MTRSGFARIALVSLACAAATGAEAAKRPYAPALSCKALQGVVAQRGAVVISTGANTYDRFVRDDRGCQSGEVTKPAWIRSADRPECFIGYTCRQYMRDDWW
ncbi:hypothetical protein [Hansschlegelia sp. KR7-227]|jgi:hypothetical protein|uniref:hypothetical protein n=1 Tax=Hansschlegelia sp. KR7-227 TaxID=3400914 RepID=UPI003C0938C4